MSGVTDPAIRAYWNARIHDTEVASGPVGSLAFFRELDAYRFGKLDYLAGAVDFNGWDGRHVLEIGCGAGIDLARFARGGARVTGLDPSATATDLARRYFREASLAGTFLLGDGTALPFPRATFDLVYCHGVLPYARDPRGIAQEAKRVLRPGGLAIFMVYHRRSWLMLLSRIAAVELGHADAPVFRTMTRREFDDVLSTFPVRRIVPERLPSPTRIQRGWKATLYNRVFVPAFRVLPAPLVRPLGWHLMAYCRSES